MVGLSRCGTAVDRRKLRILNARHVLERRAQWQRSAPPTEDLRLVPVADSDASSFQTVISIVSSSKLTPFTGKFVSYQNGKRPAGSSRDATCNKHVRDFAVCCRTSTSIRAVYTIRDHISLQGGAKVAFDIHKTEKKGPTSSA